MQPAANLDCHIPTAIYPPSHSVKKIPQDFHPPSKLAHCPLIPLHIKLLLHILLLHIE